MPADNFLLIRVVGQATLRFHAGRELGVERRRLGAHLLYFGLDDFQASEIRLHLSIDLFGCKLRKSRGTDFESPLAGEERPTDVNPERKDGGVIREDPGHPAGLAIGRGSAL